MAIIEQYAVVGNPISHSLSPVIHHQFASQMGKEINYQKIQVSELNFNAHIRNFFGEGGSGLNVTAPFKKEAYQLAAKTTQRCEKAQAANTLWLEDGIIMADNTDGIGFIRDLQKYIVAKNKKILIIGAGGAVRGILAPLIAAEPELITIANRSAENLNALKTMFSTVEVSSFDKLNPQYDIIVNATPISSYRELPVVKNIIQHASFCYDLAYLNLSLTPFISAILQLGSKGIDGLGMLVEQAAESFFIWHGFYPNSEKVLASLRQKQRC